jgi:hypothetical protein
MTARTIFADGKPAGTTIVYKAQVVDENKVPIAAASLGSMTLSLIDAASKAIVNSVNKAPILNAGRGTVDAGGNLQLTLTPADTALLVASDDQEIRTLVIDWTYSGGSKTGRKWVDILLIGMPGP